jgi:hypothetical protein
MKREGAQERGLVVGRGRVWWCGRHIQLRLSDALLERGERFLLRLSQVSQVASEDIVRPGLQAVHTHSRY